MAYSSEEFNQTVYAIEPDVWEAFYQLIAALFLVLQAFLRTFYILCQFIFYLCKTWYPFVIRYTKIYFLWALRVTISACLQFWNAPRLVKFLLGTITFGVLSMSLLRHWGVFYWIRKTSKRQTARFERRKRIVKGHIASCYSKMLRIMKEFKMNCIPLMLVVCVPWLTLSQSYRRSFFNLVLFLVPVTRSFFILCNAPYLNEKDQEYPVVTQRHNDTTKTCRQIHQGNISLDFQRPSSRNDTDLLNHTIAKCLEYWVAVCFVDLGFRVLFFALQCFFFYCFPSVVFKTFGTIHERCLWSNLVFGNNCDKRRITSVVCRYVRSGVFLFHDVVYISLLIFWLTSQSKRLTTIRVVLNDFFDRILFYIFGVRLSAFSEVFGSARSVCNVKRMSSQDTFQITKGILPLVLSHGMALFPQSFQQYLRRALCVPQLLLLFLPSIFLPFVLVVMKIIYPTIVASLSLKFQETIDHAYWTRYFVMLDVYENIFMRYLHLTGIWKYFPLKYHIELLGIICLQLASYQDGSIIFFFNTITSRFCSSYVLEGSSEQKQQQAFHPIRHQHSPDVILNNSDSSPCLFIKSTKRKGTELHIKRESHPHYSEEKVKFMVPSLYATQHSPVKESQGGVRKRKEVQQNPGDVLYKEENEEISPSESVFLQQTTKKMKQRKSRRTMQSMKNKT